MQTLIFVHFIVSLSSQIKTTIFFFFYSQTIHHIYKNNLERSLAVRQKTPEGSKPNESTYESELNPLDRDVV